MKTLDAEIKANTPVNRTTVGSTTYTATFENESFADKTEIVENLASHNLTYQSRENPTSEAEGYVSSYTCSVCEKHFGNKEVTDEISIENRKLYLPGNLNKDGHVNVIDLQMLFNIVTEN